MSSTPASSDAGGSDAKVPSRFLKHHHLAPKQLHNPMGYCSLDEVAAEDFWRFLSAGNEDADAFCELCFEDLGRQQVGISRFAEVMGKTCDLVLKHAVYFEAVMVDTFSQRLVAEAKEMKPVFDTLNLGPGSQDGGVDNLKRLAYRDVSKPRPQGLEVAARKVYEWIKDENKALLQFSSIFGAGAMYYNAEVMMVTMQARDFPGCGGLFHCEFVVVLCCFAGVPQRCERESCGSL